MVSKTIISIISLVLLNSDKKKKPWPFDRIITTWKMTRLIQQRPIFWQTETNVHHKLEKLLVKMERDGTIFKTG